MSHNYSYRLGRTKIEVRQTSVDGRPCVLLQVADQWHLVLTSEAASHVAGMLVGCAGDIEVEALRRRSSRSRGQ